MHLEVCKKNLAFTEYICFFLYLGLDIEIDKIIEMACLITDSNLNLIAEVLQQYTF